MLKSLPTWVSADQNIGVWFLYVDRSVERAQEFALQSHVHCGLTPMLWFASPSVLFFLSVPHEQAPTGRILKTVSLAREECRPWIIWSGSLELRACRVDRESVKMAIFPVVSHSLTGAL